MSATAYQIREQMRAAQNRISAIQQAAEAAHREYLIEVAEFIAREALKLERKPMHMYILRLDNTQICRNYDGRSMTAKQARDHWITRIAQVISIPRDELRDALTSYGEIEIALNTTQYGELILESLTKDIPRATNGRAINGIGAGQRRGLMDMFGDVRRVAEVAVAHRIPRFRPALSPDHKWCVDMVDKTE